jgi:hypothetical protein
MTDTAALAAIHDHVDAADAKLLLVGDHRPPSRRSARPARALR